WTTSSSNFNDLYSNGTNTGNAAGTAKTFATWQSTPVADANSVNTDVSGSFSNITFGDLHLPASISTLNGTSLSPTWVTDFDGNARAATPRMGAHERITTTPACTIHVGTAQATPFNTITGTINYLLASGITCATTIILDDATYPNEFFPITIPAIG